MDRQNRRPRSRPAGLIGGVLAALVLASACTGRHLASSENPAEEIELARLRTAVRKNPDSAEAWRKLGKHCNMYRRSEEAERAWRESLRLDADQAEVHWSLGTVYSGRGDDEAAQIEYETALTIDPEHHGALNNLGVIYRRLGRLDEAERLLKKAAETAPSSLWSLGNVYADQERWEEAAAAYEGSLSDQGWGLLGIAIVNADLGTALMKLGRDADAIRSLETALDAFESYEEFPVGGSYDRSEIAEVAYLLARLLARTGNPQEALSYLRRALWYLPEIRDRAVVEHDLEAVRRLPEAADLNL